MDVRPSDINDLEQKVKKQNYVKYLLKLKMINVRSFASQTISFDFPVTAIIGTNGGGKSTVLGAAALAYKSTKPSDFFPKSNVGDTSMSNWRIEYEILDRSAASPVFPRNSRFAAARWKRDNPPEREVVVVPIQRTVPANEVSRFRKFIGTIPKADVRRTKISDETLALISRILGKDSKNYAKISLPDDENQSILVGVSKGNDYSQFHFGAGEASIIEMVESIEAAPEFSIILIEEIENGLHPLATRKMVEYLIDVAKRKKQQIIFSTHSEYALELLPPTAIWACIDGTAYQGKLTIESLRALTGATTKNGVIFVEDEFAQDLCVEILRHYCQDLLDLVEVHKAGGFPFVIDVLKHHLLNPTTNKKAVAVIDGDNPALKELNLNVITLPDGAPESVVFSYILSNAERVSGLIQQRCQCPMISQDKIVAALREVEIDTTDHHLYFRKLGEKLGYVSEIIVRRGLCSIYVEESQGILAPLVAQIRTHLS